MKLRLFHYWRSSSSWRVRWAFALKGIPYEKVAVNLLSGENTEESHLARNPIGLVPTLEFLDGSSKYKYLSESTAIIEWAEELFPNAPLLPKSPYDRALVRQLCQTICSGTQPLQDPEVLNYHSEDPLSQKKWAQHWIARGLAAYNPIMAQTCGIYSFGDEITMADLYLIPQLYNARRFEVPLDEWTELLRIEAHALKTAECQAAHPDRFKPD